MGKKCCPLNKQLEIIALVALTPSPAATPTPKTRQKASATTPAEGKEQPEQKTKKEYKSKQENLERINQVIDAIMAHNDQAQNHDEKWAITINGIKGFGIKSQSAISDAIMARRKTQGEVEGIDDHHDRHEINQTDHNYRHRGKRKIEEVNELPRCKQTGYQNQKRVSCSSRCSLRYSLP